MPPNYKQVHDELKAAGMSSHGLRKNEARNLAALLHPDEHVKGVAYGRYTNGSAMLVATDRRILFFDKKPMFQTLDELTYDIVSGIKLTEQFLFSSLILFTRIGNYSLRFINVKSAHVFKKYLENHLLEHPTNVAGLQNNKSSAANSNNKLSKEGREYLKNNHLGVLSSLDRTGNVDGAAVYYYLAPDDSIFVLTKSLTQKSRNIINHPQVALTVFDPVNLYTMQLHGLAEVELDMQKRKIAFASIVQQHQHGYGDKLPVFQLEGDDFIVLRIKISKAKFTKYS